MSSQETKKLTVKFKKLNPSAKIPRQATAGAAGFDLHALRSYRVGAGRRAIIDTGIAAAIPKGYEGQVRPRSGLAATYGITVVNSPGTVDADYRGEVKVILLNTGDDVFYIATGDRIAQMVIQQVPEVEFEEVEELDQTERGEGGLGSTGK